MTSCILTINNFNYVYKDEQNIYWQVGLYTFVVITTWWWNLHFETCRSYVCHVCCTTQCVCWI